VISEPSRTVHLNADAEQIGRGLGGVVVTVLDLLRQLLERQALRRVDSGDLSDDEIEDLGQALLALEEAFVELRTAFGLANGDSILPVEIDDLVTATERATGDVRGHGDEFGKYRYGGWRNDSVDDAGEPGAKAEFAGRHSGCDSG
jgi:hypothetical protein